MNDPVIHAPISKIVEAFSTRLPLKVMDKTNVLNALKNALASLESSEREVLMDDMFEALSSLENDDNSIPYNMWLNIKAICDRYLAEKGVKND